MKVIDLSHTFEEGMSVFPGAPDPTFEYIGSVADGDVYQAMKFSMTTHTGTHLDCDSHVMPTGYHVDDQDMGFFIGKGIVLDASKYAPNTQIGMEIFEGKELDGVNFVLLYTGWSAKWHDPDFNDNYPYLNLEAIEFLRDHKTIRGLGVEYCAIDPVTDADLKLHKVFLSKENTIIENLTNMDKLLGKDFTLSAFPLKLKNGEGGPCRAVALLDE